MRELCEIRLNKPQRKVKLLTRFGLALLVLSALGLPGTCAAQEIRPTQPTVPPGPLATAVQTSCPGTGAPYGNAALSGGVCTFSCQGEHYDVNGTPTDGCEVADNPVGNHVQSSAANQGTLSACGSPTGTVTGMIPSDKQVHTNPAFTGFDATTGSAPDWYVVQGASGFTCQNTLFAKLTIAGSRMPSCYKLTAITDLHTYTAQANSTGTATIDYSTTNNQFTTNANIYFQVSKTCGTNVVEAPTYTLTYRF